MMSNENAIDKLGTVPNLNCYLIAEMSANHAGDLSRALEIVHAAKEAGADCIKTQTYTADTLTIDCANDYFAIHEGPWKGRTLYDLYQEAHTPWDWLARIKEEADKVGLDYLSTPFDRTAVDFLAELGVSSYKVASFELNDLPLLRYIAAQGKPVIASTGMASLGEIERAVRTVREAGNPDLCLLKCSSAYPAPPDDMNLRTIPHLAETFDVAVGLSDHTLGSAAAVAAVVLGACVVEKHFCLSRSIANPDAAFSMEPAEFRQMRDDIRAVERAMGKIQYGVSAAEEGSAVFRRSLFIVKDMKAGEAFTAENVRSIRPGYGLAPRHYDEVIGRRAAEDICRGTPLAWNLVR